MIDYAILKRQLTGRSDCQFGDGVAEEQIAAAEDQMSTRLPDDFRLYLGQLGWLEAAHYTVLGMGVDLPHPSLDLVRVTRSERAHSGMVGHLVPFFNNEAGDLTCLDSRNGHKVVTVWHESPQEPPEIVADSFDRWLQLLLYDDVFSYQPSR